MVWTPGYALLLGVTLLVEVPLVVLLAPRPLRREALRAAILVNALSHPVATWTVGEHPGAFAAVELGVVAVEAAGLAWATGLRWHRAVLLSFLANAVTTAIAGAIIIARG